MCSTPAILPIVDLAVKAANHPPAKWVFEQADVGHDVEIRVGGSFEYSMGLDPFRMKRHIILVAGGIGVNPLLSILQDCVLWMSSAEAQQATSQVTLLYSASSWEEFAFLAEIREMVQNMQGRVRVVCTVTDDARVAVSASQREAALRLATRQYGCTFSDYSSEFARAGDIEVRRGRLGVDALADAVEVAAAGRGLGLPDTTMFVCGPPRMTDAVHDMAVQPRVGLTDNQIRYEKWW